MYRTDEGEEYSSSSSSCESCITNPEEEITSRKQLNSVQKLSESDDLFTELKHLFYSNLEKTSIPRCPITSVYKSLHSSGSSRSRLRAFKASAESINRKRGDANIKKAWFSCSSKAEALKILNHGFDYSGAHLFPLDNPIDGILSTLPHSGGYQYMILCAVILGRTEEIRHLLRGLSPSTDEFDSAVDNKEIPKKFLIRPAHAKSRICPLYVLSIKPDFLRSRDLPPKMEPTSPWISLSKLVSVLCASLSPEKSRLIKRVHVDFMERKISRKEMISRVRVLSGDELLRTAIRVFGSKITRTHLVSQLKQ